MRNTLRSYYKDKRYVNNTYAFVAFNKENEDDVLGWCCIYPHWFNKLEIGTYVRYRERRRGYGTLLVKAARKFANYKVKKGLVCSHWGDEAGEGFYQAFFSSPAIRFSNRQITLSRPKTLNKP